MPDWIAFVLALVFLAGGLVDLAGPRPLRESYARWGYPPGFHLVTGVLELAAAARP